ncbi:OmpA family protein [Nesterenkonia rhizosphaerae]|uniref:OmpA-like domain-containing protein n=1 Tax=Nesterenkonia rhizosphaerae TaxID=1348272 RepID=A0ABP9FNB4_9MICC
MSNRNLLARRGLVGLSAGVLVFAATAGASADPVQDQPSAPGDTDGADHSSFVVDINAPEFVVDINPTDFVMELGNSESEDEEVIVLETDILFPAMEWELPAEAGSRLTELVEEVPEGSQVQVHGHTDSNPVPDGHDFDNEVLSGNRAQAVADSLAESRPDLTLEVAGFGEAQPAVTEDPEDPSTYAANRRVEIRYGE